MSEEIGARIKEARLAAGMTQKELAEAVDGLSAKAISEAERGLRELTDEQIVAIADATGVSPESLLGTAEEAPEEESEGLVIDDEEILSLIKAAPPSVKGAVLSVLKGEDNPVNAITGVLGGILGGKKPAAKGQDVDDEEILALLKEAAPGVKETVLSLLKG